MVFRVRELLIRQRTQAINALRAHAEWLGLLIEREIACRNTRRFQTRIAQRKAAPYRGGHRRCRLPDATQAGQNPIPAARHRSLDRRTHASGTAPS